MWALLLFKLAKQVICIKTCRNDFVRMWKKDVCPLIKIVYISLVYLLKEGRVYKAHVGVNFCFPGLGSF